MLENLFIIVGLGNPGKKYDRTRHNVGFLTVDALSDSLKINVTKLKHKALVGEGFIGDKKIVLAKPQTFMNLSGESVREIAQWYKVSVTNLILIYDDVDLSLGRVRLRARGSSGTHNGMKSVIYQLQSDEFPRIRIGIDSPREEVNLAGYVLGKFTDEEQKVMEKSILWAAQAAQAIVLHGINNAMNKYNVKESLEENA